MNGFGADRQGNVVALVVRALLREFLRALALFAGTALVSASGLAAKLLEVLDGNFAIAVEAKHEVRRTRTHKGESCNCGEDAELPIHCWTRL